MNNPHYILGDNLNNKRPIIHTGDNSDLIRIANEVDKKNKDKYKKKDDVKQPVNETSPTITPELKDFVYVPSLGLYIGKNRVLNSLSWDDAINKIYVEKCPVNVNGTNINAEMPSPYEFMTFVNSLLSKQTITGLNNTERRNILNDILKAGTYMANHLNARFIRYKKGFNNFGIQTATFDASGNLVRKPEPLEHFLLNNGYADITSVNSQGLLTKDYSSIYEQGKNAYFLTPSLGTVARFVASPDRAYLACNGNPAYQNSSLGVRLVVRPKSNQKTSGGQI